MTLIETKTLGASAASIEFASIPQTYTDLLFAVSVRATGVGSDNVADGTFRFNSSTANFSYRFLGGNGINSFSGTGASAGFIGWHPSSSATSNTFGNAFVYIPNYTATTNRSYSVDSMAENNATVTYSCALAGLWSNSAVISNIAFFTSATDFAIGSTISLYGILKGSSGGVTVS
jgi:hypothetical protein